MMLAMHVEQHAAPDFALVEAIVEALDPGRFDQEKVQTGFGAIALDGVDE
jgi:hypothetical protein